MAQRKAIKTATIYALRAKGETEPFYIGSTSRDPKIRFGQHLRSQFKEGQNPFIHLKITSVGKKNVENRIEPIINKVVISEAEWMKRGAQREVIWLKMTVRERDVPPAIFERIQNLPWPREFPKPPTKEEIKRLCDFLELKGSRSRQEYYKAGETFARTSN